MYISVKVISKCNLFNILLVQCVSQNSHSLRGYSYTRVATRNLNSTFLQKHNNPLTETTSRYSLTQFYLHSWLMELTSSIVQLKHLLYTLAEHCKSVVIISNKHGICELPHEKPNNSKTHTLEFKTILSNWKPIKNDEKCFLFHLQALLVLKIFKFLS